MDASEGLESQGEEHQGDIGSSKQSVGDDADKCAAEDPHVQAIHAYGLRISPWQVFNQDELARAFGKHPITIKRAVERGELPPPVRLMGKPTWTGASILKHLETRLNQARESADVFNRNRATPTRTSHNER